jgi:nicotinate-nucleotide adenylyltransferase
VVDSVGILGGTFDPIHLGHLAAATKAIDALDLDRVLLVVANDPWQKSPTRTISPAEERLEMVARSVASVPRVEASDLEIRRGGPSYMIDTVAELEAEQGVHDPWIIVGADLAATLDTWERADELARRVRIAVLSRPGSPLFVPEGWRAVAIEGDDVDISSSDVRRAVAAGEDIASKVPQAVIEHLARRNLYA